MMSNSNGPITFHHRSHPALLAGSRHPPAVCSAQTLQGLEVLDRIQKRFKKGESSSVDGLYLDRNRKATDAGSTAKGSQVLFIE